VGVFAVCKGDIFCGLIQFGKYFIFMGLIGSNDELKGTSSRYHNFKGMEISTTSSNTN
jgi:hypothetical protein